MTDATLVAELADMVRTIAEIPPGVAITAESRFSEDLGVDSLDMVAIVFSVQDRYGIKIGEDDLPALGGMSELASYVSHRQASAAA
jgi:acyl carrier protein